MRNRACGAEERWKLPAPGLGPAGSEGDPDTIRGWTGWAQEEGATIACTGFVPGSRKSGPVCLVCPSNSPSHRRKTSPPWGLKALLGSCPALMPPLSEVSQEKGGAGGRLRGEAGRRQSVTVTCSCALLSTG